MPVLPYISQRLRGLVALMAVGLSLTAFAQDGAPAPAAAPTVDAATAAPEPSADDKAAAKSEAQADETPVSRYVETGEKALVEMRDTLTKSLVRLRVARVSKDAVEVTCVNEQVTPMKGILRLSEEAFIQLQEAMATNSVEEARYEYRKIRRSAVKFEDLYSIALNCAGAEASVSNTSVMLEVDPNLVEHDPYYGNSDFFFTPGNTLLEVNNGILGSTDNPDARFPPASGVL